MGGGAIPGDCYHDKAKHAEAIDMYTQSLAQDPLQCDLYSRRGDCHLQLDNPAEVPCRPIPFTFHRFNDFVRSCVHSSVRVAVPWTSGGCGGAGGRGFAHCFGTYGRFSTPLDSSPAIFSFQPRNDALNTEPGFFFFFFFVDIHPPPLP